jgi:hypothetical protein
MPRKNILGRTTDVVMSFEIERENWHSYFREESWQEYRQTSGKIGMRFEHIDTEKTYEECQMWFARCHEDVYGYFTQLVARR